MCRQVRKHLLLIHHLLIVTKKSNLNLLDMKKIIQILGMIISLVACNENVNKDFDDWQNLKIGQYQSGPVENYTKEEINRIKYKDVDMKALKPLLQKFEIIDSTKVPFWFDNMLGVVVLKNGDSLKINLGFPTALFRNTKTRKVYILKNKYYAREWENLVFPELILSN